MERKIDLKVSVSSQLYRDVLGKIRKKLNKNAGIPWMKYKEIDILEETIRNLEPKKCLEWGAGFSTVTFPGWLTGDYSWHSIEHDLDWAERMNLLNINKRVFIDHVAADSDPPYEDEHQDGSYKDFKNYIEKPKELGINDFILIDGRARKYCVKRSYDLLSEYGVVVLHDANREHYYDYFHLFKHQCLFTDYLNMERGLWIASKERPIESLINIAKFQRNWRIHYKLGIFFRKK
ncbi:hypothetical protein ACFLU5_04140 [Bacteroidota bacterium]